MALVAGFIGGVLSAWFIRPQVPATPLSAVRAHEFDLVDEEGHAVSFWGFNTYNRAELVFGSHWSDAPEKSRAHLDAALRQDENQMLAIGAGGDFPFLDFRAADGKPRISLFVEQWGKPALMMSDETAARVVLGIKHTDTHARTDNNWALEFGHDSASIGMGTVVENGQQYVQGEFSVNRNKEKYP